jgi:NADPH:quinone reductase-like Zn-dependent oxidoreductase
MDTMRAVVIDRFGGPETLELREVPVPSLAGRDVLIRVEAAGVGSWDPFEREGGYAEMQGTEPAFPYILGSEGAGTIVAVGPEVVGVAPGDRVYAAAFLNPKGGFYAEYAAVDASLVSAPPDHLTTDQAGAMPGVAVTALRGLDDVLAVQAGERVAVVGAGGGIGHVAVQLAGRLGARVLAVASGPDGVALAEAVGADVAVDGRAVDLAVDVAAACRAFAAQGLDAVLLTAGGPVADAVVSCLRTDGEGRAAYPTGVMPEPAATPYNGEPDRDILDRLDKLIAAAPPFDVHVARAFPLAAAADAHRALDEHHLGKLVLHPRDSDG